MNIEECIKLVHKYEKLESMNKAIESCKELNVCIGLAVAPDIDDDLVLDEEDIKTILQTNKNRMKAIKNKLGCSGVWNYEE